MQQYGVVHVDVRGNVFRACGTFLQDGTRDFFGDFLGLHTALSSALTIILLCLFFILVVRCDMLPMYRCLTVASIGPSARQIKLFNGGKVGVP